MSATIDSINARYNDSIEKLLAASSQIIRLEALIASANNVMQIKDANITALLSIADSTVDMLNAMRCLVPDSVLPNFDATLGRAVALLANVRKHP